MDLNILWFNLLGVLLAGYAVLDGFDLGVGILHPLARKDAEKRTFMNAIGPVWDGNEVWLITFGGALFAAFPHAYATVFSGFYLAFMLLLFALIFRAVSMEFRSKAESPVWRGFWDKMFFGGSTVATLLFGTAVGDSIHGIPVGADMEYAGGFLDLLHPYALLVGVMTVALFAMHGALYLVMKTDGDLLARVRRAAGRAFTVYLVLWAATAATTLAALPAARETARTNPASFAILALGLLVLVGIPFSLRKEKPFRAFLLSSLHIATLVGLLGTHLYPNLVISSLNPEWNLTIRNAASSPQTLRNMTIIALIGVPLVLLYTVIIYRTFKGKVKLGETSY
ncbi:MAG: cytochrome d ubiquinol oxidase subunit II [Candidatus Eisenbacteria bacterium]|nr:cytochrome d ubiquinol oxidase subunit II [Candidatus Eisenbacteria bacterium]